MSLATLKEGGIKMSRNNYNKQYKPEVNTEGEFKTSIAPVVEETPEVKVDPSTDPINNKTPEETPEVKPIRVMAGVISDCKKLNIRNTPDKDGEIIAVLDVDTDVSINMDESTKDFYKVSTLDGIEGYCMTKFVALL